MCSEQLNEELVRLERLAETLERKTEDLNDLIEALAERLDRAGVSVTAWLDSTVMPGWKFGYCKVNGGWTLAAKKGKGGVMPLSAAPRKLRLAAMGRADELIKALADKSEQFLGDVEKATEIAQISLENY